MFTNSARNQIRSIVVLCALACLAAASSSAESGASFASIAGIAGGAAMAKPVSGVVAVPGGADGGDNGAGLDSWWAPSGKRFRAGKPFHAAQRWSPGQYVILGESVDGVHQLARKILLVRREGKDWVFELETVDGEGLHLNQALVSGVDEALKSADVSKLRLLWVKSIGKDGKVATTRGLALDIMGRLMRGQISILIAQVGDHVAGGAVRVPAGSFADTSIELVTTKGLFTSSETKSWYNSAVPINGLVRCVTDNGKRVIELLGFGFSGKPKFPEG